MITTIKFEESETRAILTLAGKFNISPQNVVRELIRNRLGFYYLCGSLNDQLGEEANEMINGRHPDELIADDSACSTTSHDQGNSELIPITEAARILNLSISRVRARSRKKGDPIRAAKSRVGKQKPMHFHRSMLEQVQHLS